MTTQQHENALRDRFVEDQLPELLEKEKQRLLNQFEENELPELLEKAKQQLRDTFEGELAELMTSA